MARSETTEAIAAHKPFGSFSKIEGNKMDKNTKIHHIS
jgi:hypothetical protein